MPLLEHISAISQTPILKAGVFQQGQFIIIRKVGEKMGKCHELSAMNYWISQKIIFKFIGNGFGRYAKGVPCSYEFKR